MSRLQARPGSRLCLQSSITAPACLSRRVMQTSAMKVLIKAILPSVLLISLAAHAQGLLVGPSTRNGSFEDGASSPWGGIAAVSQDASFASDGEWFAAVQSTLRTYSWQYIPVDLVQGGGFIVSFDARTGAPAFGSVFWGCPPCCLWGASQATLLS
jgi:hypothetical protein